MDADPSHGPRIAALERRVDAIMRHLGIAEPQVGMTVSARVQQLALEGNKIEAIKAYREETGADLRTAKAAVDALY